MAKRTASKPHFLSSISHFSWFGVMRLSNVSVIWRFPDTHWYQTRLHSFLYPETAIMTILLSVDFYLTLSLYNKTFLGHPWSAVVLFYIEVVQYLIFHPPMSFGVFASFRMSHCHSNRCCLFLQVIPCWLWFIHLKYARYRVISK